MAPLFSSCYHPFRADPPAWGFARINPHSRSLREYSRRGSVAVALHVAVGKQVHRLQSTPSGLGCFGS